MRLLGVVVVAPSLLAHEAVLEQSIQGRQQFVPLAAKVGETLAQVTKLKGEVQLAAIGTLPNDGKVISDERSYG